MTFLQTEVLLDQADSSNQGFDAEHKDIDLLRLKSFTLTRKLDDKEVLGQQGLARISELIATLVPFVSQTFLFVRLSFKTTISVIGSGRSDGMARLPSPKNAGAVPVPNFERIKIWVDIAFSFNCSTCSHSFRFSVPVKGLI